MIIQSVGHEQNERKNTKKLMEWESPKWIDGYGGTLGECRL
ncbi:hypothetical protein [Sporosarcina koreensis]|uniref:Uncharacterized protein n=1 Tax=Sporosarcina koreensis TaxID=334735 RepID=A0ABW0TWU7_9BACL